MSMRWSRGEWKAVCATFCSFERQIGVRKLEYVSTIGVAAASGVSTATARRALNKLVGAGVLVAQGSGSVLYQYRKSP